jgi:hypothetical protein
VLFPVSFSEELKKQPQIPSLRCGMTNKRAGNGNSNCNKSEQQPQIPSLRYGRTNKRADNGKRNVGDSSFGAMRVCFALAID